MALRFKVLDEEHQFALSGSGALSRQPHGSQTRCTLFNGLALLLDFHPDLGRVRLAGLSRQVQAGVIVGAYNRKVRH
jgi:hypothetical protein